MNKIQAWNSTTLKMVPFWDAFWNKAGQQQSHQVSNRLAKELLPYLISGLIWNRSFSIVQPLLKIGLRMHFWIHVRKEKDQEKGNSSHLLFCFNNYSDLQWEKIVLLKRFVFWNLRLDQFIWKVCTVVFWFKEVVGKSKNLA